MQDFKESQWARQIIDSQHTDGKWGYFHSLSNPTKTNYITTEQALRRLQILGFTENDSVIQKSLAYMSRCLNNEEVIPDRVEKCHDWNAFTELILSTWICRFTKTNKKANAVALKWKDIISCSLQKDTLDFTEYRKVFTKYFSSTPKGGRLIDPINFYVLSIVSSRLSHDIEHSFLEFVLQYQNGIYYVYGKSLSCHPLDFKSKEASRFIGAFELLSDYPNTKGTALFSPFMQWIYKNQKADGIWDMGASAKDGIFLPLSDSWRKHELREADCTYRINKLLQKLK